MQARSMLFTLFGDYVRYAGGEIGTASLLRIMGELGFSDQTVRAALSRLSKQGWLTGRKAGSRSFYALTPQAWDRLEEAGRRIYQADPPPWDGHWRMLTYSIPEARRDVRDALRKELVWTGFGQLASGIWISPCDLTERVSRLIDRYGLRDRVDLFTAAYHGPDRDADLVARCWDLPALRAHYDRFLAEFAPRAAELISLAGSLAGLPDNRAFVERARLVHEYRKFLFDDPGLPADLLPADWPRPTATRLFADLYRLLAPGADRFFADESNTQRRESHAHDHAEPHRVAGTPRSRRKDPPPLGDDGRVLREPRESDDDAGRFRVGRRGRV